MENISKVSETEIQITGTQEINQKMSISAIQQRLKWFDDQISHLQEQRAVFQNRLDQAKSLGIDISAIGVVSDVANP